MSQRIVPLLALACACCASAGLAATTRIVAWGDSITYGYFDGSSAASDCTAGEPSNDPPEECGYTGRLDARLDDPNRFVPVYDVDVLNLGKGGERTGSGSAEALSRIDQPAWTCPCDALANPCPINSLKYWVCNGTVEPEDLFVLMEGTNDVSSGISAETIGFNLEQLGLKAEVYDLNVLIGTLLPRHPDACVDAGNNQTEQVNDEVLALSAGRDWPLIKVYERMINLVNNFTLYYQDWQPMKCADPAPTCNGSNPCDPVGHPNGTGYNKLTYDASGTNYQRTFEYTVRGALPPRVTLGAPAGPLQSGVTIDFSATFPDIATYLLTYALDWDFGDGSTFSTSTTTSPAPASHVFWYAGETTVSLTATHPNGGSRTVSIAIQLEPGAAVFLDGFESGDTSAWIEGNVPGEE